MIPTLPIPNHLTSGLTCEVRCRQRSHQGDSGLSVPWPWEDTEEGRWGVPGAGGREPSTGREGPVLLRCAGSDTPGQGLAQHPPQRQGSQASLDRQEEQGASRERLEGLSRAGLGQQGCAGLCCRRLGPAGRPWGRSPAQKGRTCERPAAGGGGASQTPAGWGGADLHLLFPAAPREPPPTRPTWDGACSRGWGHCRPSTGGPERGSGTASCASPGDTCSSRATVCPSTPTAMSVLQTPCGPLSPTPVDKDPSTRQSRGRGCGLDTGSGVDQSCHTALWSTEHHWSLYSGFPLFDFGLDKSFKKTSNLVGGEGKSV